MLARTLGK
jgi:uncharacterized membrane protein (DUF373 family)